MWKLVGATDFIIRVIQYGVWDPPIRPFLNGCILHQVPQTAADLEFGRNELKEGCEAGLYQEVSKSYALEQVRKGHYISSAFIDWNKGKGRFIINLKKQSKHWDKKSIRLQPISAFSASLLPEDYMLSFDWKGGYRHFRLHPKMWDWFLFRYDGKFYQCISLPFGWTASPFWFCHILSPLTRYIRSELQCRVLQWIDDYLLVPGLGNRPSTAADCLKLSSTLDKLFPKLGLLRHASKGVWGSGTQRLEHLGLIIDTKQFRFFITSEKLTKLHDKAAHLIQTAAKSCRWVRESVVSSFTGVAISQLIPIPLARFFTRGLYDDMTINRPRRGRYPEQQIRLSNAGLRDLHAWKTMLSGDGRLIGGGTAKWNLHTDAADVGYGATLGTDLRAGTPGETSVQSIWSPFLRLQSITLRELTAVRMALQTDLFQSKLQNFSGKILLHVDNMAVFHIVNNMVSSKPKLISELRKLHQLLVEMKVTLTAQWIPSALNKHADRLSRTWNPYDIYATPSLMRSLAESLRLQTVRRLWPFKDSPIARAKVLQAQFEEFWGDGVPRLWNPPPPLITMTLLKIKHEDAHGIIVVPHWTGAPWYNMLKTIRISSQVILPGEVHLFDCDYANPAWSIELVEIGRPHRLLSNSLLPVNFLTPRGAVQV